MGDKAFNTSGVRPILRMPVTARTVNHNSITGPNTLPTASVPWRWIRNRTTTMAKVAGMM